MSPEEFARSSWQATPANAALPALEELRARSDRLRRTIRRRSLVEYTAGIFVVVAFSAIALFAPLVMMRIGAAMIVGGTLVVLWQLHRRGSPLTPSELDGQLSVLDFQRRELARQRDAVDSVFAWYLLPLIPGMLVLMASPLSAVPMEEWQAPPLGVALRLLLAPAVFGGVYALNKFAARRLQREIDAIDRLRAG